MQVEPENNLKWFVIWRENEANISPLNEPLEFE